MRKIFILCVLVLVAATTGCSINHPVAKDYDQFLAKYGSETTLPKTDVNSDYLIEDKTKNHSYQFRAATVGYAHIWIVEFGEILDKTINSEYVQSAFGTLNKSDVSDGNSENLVEFELKDYEFKNYRAYTTLKIKVMKKGHEVFSKVYHSEGRGQGGQMWAAGPFGMKNATLKSTKQSIDKILTEFINDINTEQVASK